MVDAVTIDIVSDVVCPWCAIGISGLNRAIENLDGAVKAELRFHPFELDPEMASTGRDMLEMFANKFGMGPEQIAASRETLRARGDEVGFTFTFADDRRVYNTFDAHRLLHWAGIEGGQEALKLALFRAFFTDGRDISDRDELVAIVQSAGLDAASAREVLASGRYADDVRKEEQHWRQAGINSVPSFIINEKYLISGGQPVAAFEQALKQIAAGG